MSSYWEVSADAVARWALQETAGTTASDETASHPATLQGGFSFDTSSVPGPRGWLPAGLGFNGVSNRVSIPSPATLGLGSDHTIAMWAQVGVAPPWSDQVLLEIGGVNHATVVQLQGDSIYVLTVRNGSVSSAGAVATTGGGWRHIAAVLSNSKVELYLDGVLAASAIPSTAWTASGDDEGALGAVDDGVWLSGSSSSGIQAAFTGGLAGVVVFDRSLSAEEVGELYHGPEPTLAAVPALSGGVRAGESAAAVVGEWDGFGNGATVATSVVEVSNGGVTGWQELEYTRDLTPFTIPIWAEGKSLRIVATAANDGGSGEPAYSPPLVVQAFRGPARPAAGAVRSNGPLAGRAKPTGGALAGSILPGEAMFS